MGESFRFGILLRDRPRPMRVTSRRAATKATDERITFNPSTPSGFQRLALGRGFDGAGTAAAHHLDRVDHPETAIPPVGRHERSRWVRSLQGRDRPPSRLTSAVQ